MTNIDPQARANRLAEIKDEIFDLIVEARQLVADTGEEDRANGTWLARIRMALDNDHEYFGEVVFTMQESIWALAGGYDGE